MTNQVTEDWSEFGHREKEMAIELLEAWNKGKFARDNLEMGSNVRAAFNLYSGYVFLTNDEYNAFMLDENGNLEIFLSCPECGNEGFPSELRDNANCNECKEFASYYLDEDHEAV